MDGIKEEKIFSADSLITFLRLFYDTFTINAASYLFKQTILMSIITLSLIIARKDITHRNCVCVGVSFQKFEILSSKINNFYYDMRLVEGNVDY